MQKQLLLVEDDEQLREAIYDTLVLAGIKTVAVDSAEEAVERLAKHKFDMLISDVNMHGMDGYQLLGLVKRQYPYIPVLLMTAYGDVSQAVEAIRNGAVDYLLKPFEPQALLALVNRYAGGTTAAHNEDAPVAVAPGSQQLLGLADRVANTDSTVLITGESGTGKEVLARYIHAQSARADQPFIAINCAAIPDNMLEATLFGHEKGAFTGAYSSMPGKFEQANGGTLLLDEISEMNLALQAKLLRVLQEQEVERIGGRKIIKLDVRVLATSNRNLQQEAQNGEFREDLYYRLSVFPLKWPPLRERIEDILPLANRLLAKHARKMKRAIPKLSPCAEQRILGYPWPGNVRELENCMQRALILQHGLGTEKGQTGQLSAAEILLDPGATEHLAMTSQQPQPQAQGVAETEAEQIVSKESIPSTGDQSQAGLGADLKQREYQIIIDTLKKAGGRRNKAAELLGISPRTLRYKIAKMRELGMTINDKTPLLY